MRIAPGRAPDAIQRGEQSIGEASLESAMLVACARLRRQHRPELAARADVVQDCAGGPPCEPHEGRSQAAAKRPRQDRGVPASPRNTAEPRAGSRQSRRSIDRRPVARAETRGAGSRGGGPCRRRNRTAARQCRPDRREPASGSTTAVLPQGSRTTRRSANPACEPRRRNARRHPTPSLAGGLGENGAAPSPPTPEPITTASKDPSA